MPLSETACPVSEKTRKKAAVSAFFCVRLQKCFDLLAARGIYMWLLHSLFFLTPGAAQFQNILYLSKSPLLVFLWGFLIVFLAACLLRFLAETVSRWVSHLNRKSLPK